MKLIGAVSILVVVASLAHADDPRMSLRPPILRSEEPRQPRSFPVPLATVPETKPTIVQDDTDGGLLRSLRPLFRSPKAEERARTRLRELAKGQICGDVAIQGKTVGQVRGTLDDCGLDDAVRVRAVSGVALTTESVMDCRTASALNTWMKNTAKPALAQAGGGLKSIRVAGHYACRGRNNQKGAKISEHGKGRAIDISGFRLENGSEISVLEGWSAGGHAGVLRAMHQGACGPFGTVLGPEANRWHHDHFHFDTARHRSGSYCR